MLSEPRCYLFGMLRIISVVRGSLRMREGSIGSVGEDSSEEAWRRPRRRPVLAGWADSGLAESPAGRASVISLTVSALASLAGRAVGGKYSCAAVKGVSGVEECAG